MVVLIEGMVYVFVGVFGEFCLYGFNVGLGYIGMSLVFCFWCVEDNGWSYFMGDRCVLFDGNFYFYGRIDR